MLLQGEDFLTAAEISKVSNFRAHYMGYTADKLKTENLQRDLKQAGNKPELAARLALHDVLKGRRSPAGLRSETKT